MAGPLDTPLYPAAILLPLFSLISIILELPPFIWHLRNRNFGAISLITWLFLIQAMNIINPFIWPRDNIWEWWDGRGLCDIEIRLQVAATVGIPGAVTCIVRRLAHILNVDKTTLASPLGDKLQKALDVWLCVGFPVLVMVLYYIVQPNRFNIYTITGCSWPIDQSWPSVVLVVMWPLILSTINAYLAGMVMIRLFRYRQEFSQIVSISSTNKSRFFRLLFISIVVILAILPQTIYAMYTLLANGLVPYDWNFVHNLGWDIVKIPARGRVVVWSGPASAVCGLFVFIAFGRGKDATAMYKSWLEAIGLGGVVRWLEKQRDDDSGSLGDSFRTLASKVNLIRSESRESPTATRRSTIFRLPPMDFGNPSRRTSKNELPVYEKS